MTAGGEPVLRVGRGDDGGVDFDVDLDVDFDFPDFPVMRRILENRGA